MFKELRQAEKSVEYEREGIQLAKMFRDEKQLAQFYGNLCGDFGIWYDVTSDKKYL